MDKLDKAIDRYTEQYNEALKRNNDNRDFSTQIIPNNVIDYYMSLSEFTTLECVLKSLKEIKEELNK